MNGFLINNYQIIWSKTEDEAKNIYKELSSNDVMILPRKLDDNEVIHLVDVEGEFVKDERIQYWTLNPELEDKILLSLTTKEAIDSLRNIDWTFKELEIGEGNEFFNILDM